MTTQSTTRPRFTPPRWLNALMRGMLRTPGLQRVVGRSTALITFTGRRTGRTFTTPASYVRTNGQVVLSSHVTRQWWRNLATRPTVRLRLAGRDVVGTATVLTGTDAIPALTTYWQSQPRLARAMGVELVEGVPDPNTFGARLQDTVAVVVDVAGGGS